MRRRAILLGLLAASCDSRSSVSGPSLGQDSSGAAFVAPNGNDANAGTELAPVRTFARALSLVRPGMTLFLKGGVYQEELSGGIPSGVSWSAPVRIAGFPGQPAIVRPVGTDRVLYFAGPSYVVVDGLILDGARVAFDCIKITTGGGGRSHHIRIQNTEVMNAPGQGILLSDGADSNEFISVRVHDNGRSSDFVHGMYITTNGNLIDNCDIYRNSGWGVHAYPAPNNLTVRGCRIYQNARAGARGEGIGLYGGQGLRALGNEVSGNAKGIAVDGTTGAEVTGNRVHGNRGEGIVIRGPAQGTRVEGNTASGNGGGDLIDQGAGTRLGSNQIG
jgi:parallel beta-helix repeat protein